MGRKVGSFDLWTLAIYLTAAGAILWWLAWRQSKIQAPAPSAGSPEFATEESRAAVLKPTLSTWRKARTWLIEEGPYSALQFFFGGLFSALFIFYFKSSSHFSAYATVAGLGGLLIANEFLEGHYGRFTLTWTLFGLCSMLLLNFVIPHLLGSLNPIWFYLSTLCGAGGTLVLRHFAPGRPGKPLPIAAAALALVAAYRLDIIPPVPLVKKNLVVGRNFERDPGIYRIRIERAPWYLFWRWESPTVHLSEGERLYCLSSVYAPKGMHTKLYHTWLHKDSKRGWKTVAKVGFAMNGGREYGYRGYTYKQSPQPGLWRVELQAADGRTVGSHEFTVIMDSGFSADSLPTWEM